MWLKWKESGELRVKGGRVISRVLLSYPIRDKRYAIRQAGLFYFSNSLNKLKWKEKTTRSLIFPKL